MKEIGLMIMVNSARIEVPALSAEMQEILVSEAEHEKARLLKIKAEKVGRLPTGDLPYVVAPNASLLLSGAVAGDVLERIRK